VSYLTKAALIFGTIAGGDPVGISLLSNIATTAHMDTDDFAQPVKVNDGLKTADVMRFKLHPF